MNKPIFRWTVGNVSNLGISILKKSICLATEIYKDRFKWIVCYNNLEKYQVDALRKISDKVILYEQQWKEFPFLDCSSYFKKNQLNNSDLIGSIWKLCPPRLDINVPEIVVDNDIVIYKELEEIELFLQNSNPMISKACNFFQGDFPSKEPCNSGFFGLPAGFDFQKKLFEKWILKNKKDINYGDEQGLVTQALLSENCVLIPCSKLCLFPPTAMWFKNTNFKKEGYFDYSENTTYTFDLISNCSGIHFIGANRSEFHSGWSFCKRQLFS